MSEEHEYEGYPYELWEDIHCDKCNKCKDVCLSYTWTTYDNNIICMECITELIQVRAMEYKQKQVLT